MSDELLEIADELYALPPAEFTAARDAKAKELKGTDLAGCGEGAEEAGHRRLGRQPAGAPRVRSGRPAAERRRRAPGCPGRHVRRRAPCADQAAAAGHGRRHAAGAPPRRRGRAQGHPVGRRPGGGDADRGDGRRRLRTGGPAAGCWSRPCRPPASTRSARRRSPLPSHCRRPSASRRPRAEAPEPGPPSLHVVPDPDAAAKARAAVAERLDQAAASYDEADAAHAEAVADVDRLSARSLAAAGRDRRAAAPARRPRVRARRGR